MVENHLATLSHSGAKIPSPEHDLHALQPALPFCSLGSQQPQTCAFPGTGRSTFPRLLLCVWHPLFFLPRPFLPGKILVNRAQTSLLPMRKPFPDPQSYLVCVLCWPSSVWRFPLSHSPSCFHNLSFYFLSSSLELNVSRAKAVLP